VRIATPPEMFEVKSSHYRVAARPPSFAASRKLQFRVPVFAQWMRSRNPITGRAYLLVVPASQFASRARFTARVRMTE
jgi:hypothetical protein